MANPSRRHGYDEDLLVTLIAQGRLSCRKIAGRVGISASMVGAVARGDKRPDLYERICQVVEYAHRRVRRLVADSMLALAKKHLHEALQGTGESARKCREFLMRTFLNTSDPAGRHVGQAAGPNAAKPTRDEQALIAALRGGDSAATYDTLPTRLRKSIDRFVPDLTETPQYEAIGQYIRTEMAREYDACEDAQQRHWSLREELDQLSAARDGDKPPAYNALPAALQNRLDNLQPPLPADAKSDKPLDNAVLDQLLREINADIAANRRHQHVLDERCNALAANYSPLFAVLNPGVGRQARPVAGSP